MALVQKFETDFGIIRITRGIDGAIAYYQNGCFHSQANRNGVSICAYVHVMFQIIRQKKARNVLIIGCAGGTLATMLRRIHCRVTVVDINPAAFTIARKYFRLPEDVQCVCKDGIAFLKTTRKIYDAVVIDVFGSNNMVPRNFTTPAFFKTVSDVLPEAGVMIMNVITANDADGQADSFARNAQGVGMDINMFDWPRQKDRNTLIVGGALSRVAIPSGLEPTWIKSDLRGLIRRKPLKRTFE